MKIAIAQINSVVGSFKENREKIESAWERAEKAGADLLVTPELATCGYPPHDLLHRPEMVLRDAATVEELLKFSKGKSCALALGHVKKNEGSGKPSFNQVSVIEDGKVVFEQAKTLLPTYDVFDEVRYFEPATKNELFEFRGMKVAIAICEDLWANDPQLKCDLYGKDPVDSFEGADCVISVSASPFELAKKSRREDLHTEVSKRVKAPLIYVNQVGATDEILFDGTSFATGADGKILGRLAPFDEDFGIVEIANDKSCKLVEFESKPELEGDALIRKALVTGIQEYFRRTGFKKAILGLSGGIDSAVLTCLAAEALGPGNVLCFAMPSQYSSGHSLEDAEILSRNLKISLEIKPIKFLFSQFLRETSERRQPLADIAQENLQARIRGTFLMTIANHEGALVLATSNKSELATGYSTLYGDMVGALCPLGDLTKVAVYNLAREYNREGEVIPQRIIDKPPSAELKPDQKDEDTLPPYSKLDPLVVDYFENRTPLEELRKQAGSDSAWLEDMVRKFELNEYKRRQAAPVLKVSVKAFGIGRRIPVAKRWDV